VPDPEAEAEFESACDAGGGGECSGTPMGEPTATPCTGTPAQLNGEGAFACGDGSEPVCPAGYSLDLSPDGSLLLCTGEAGEAAAGESPG
jgi:hypothetical protein